MLTFDVMGQTLIRTDNFEPATDSVNYLMAEFAFRTDEWRTNNTKTALFRLGETVYPAILDAEGKCIVPWEALVHGDSQYARKNGSTVFVSLKAEKGTTRIPTDEVPVKLNSSGYGDTEEPEEPTPDVYQQIMTSFGEMQTRVDTTMKTVGNAIKGVKTGAIVAMDDVSPFYHNPTVKVFSRNLLNPAEFLSGNSNTSRTYADGVLTVTGYYVSQVVYGLTVGKTYNLSFTSTRTGDTGGGVAVEFRDDNNNKLFGYYHTSTLSKTLTFTVPNGTHHLGIYLYGSDSTSGTTSATYTELMLVEGGTGTEYTAWVDPTTVTVHRHQKNLMNVTGTTKTTNGVTFTVLDGGTIHARGTSTGVITYFLDASVKVVSGERYILSGCPAGGNEATGYALRFYDGVGRTPYDTGDGVEIDWTNVGANYNFAITIRSGVTMNHTFRPMLRHASIKDGTFERFQWKTNTPDADGTVTSFLSTSPCMTFLTEVEGVTLECEYNRDATKALGAVDLAPFIINMTLNGTTIASIDKTYADTLAAFKAGRLVECRVDAGRDGYYTLPPVRVYGADGIIFGGHSGNMGTVWTTVTFLDSNTATFTTS